MSAALDIALGLGLLWFFGRIILDSRRERARHTWGELDSSQVVRVLDKKRRKMYL